VGVRTSLVLRLELIKKRRPGHECTNTQDLSYTTAASYLSLIKIIRAKWGKMSITKVKPALVQEWLQDIKVAPKTKGDIQIPNAPALRKSDVLGGHQTSTQSD
jgi:hypothetical protein